MNAAPSSINQGATSQLSGTATLDDGTTEALSRSAIVGIPPVIHSSFSNGGLLTAATNVYSNPAGTSGHLSRRDRFTTVTVNGPYASSIIPDSWFPQYFDSPEPSSRPDGRRR